MSVHKAEKVRNLVQTQGLLHTGTGHGTNADFGVVGEYLNAGNTIYTGLVRHYDGYFYLFDSLQTNPFTPNGSGVPGENINTSGTGFTLADLVMRTLTVATINATANITTSAGNITATAGSVTAGNAVLSGNTISTSSGALNILPAGTSSLILGATGNKVILPQDPTTATEAATKNYVDTLVQGLTPKQECRVRTTTDLATSPGITVAGSGATHTLTRSANGAIGGDSASFDGITLVLGDRVLVMMQGTGAGAAADNGIYTVTNAGSAGTKWVLTRSSDTNTSADFSNGMFTFVNVGTQYATTGWILSTANPITLETTALSFVQFSQFGVTTGSQLDPSGFNIFKQNSGTTLQFRGLIFNNTVSGNTASPVEAVTSANDITVNFDGSKVTTVGALASGSIATGFGAISTSNNITTTATDTAGTLQTTAGAWTVTGSTETFNGTTGNNVISIPDNLTSALAVKDGATAFMTFVTTTGSQGITVAKPLTSSNGQLVFTNASTASNNLTVPTNLANGFQFLDSAAVSYARLITTTGNPSWNFDVPVNMGTATINNLVLNGGFTHKVTAVSANTTLTNAYDVVNVTTSASTITITLPSATTNQGQEYIIAKVDSGTGTVSVAPASGDYVDGVQNDTIALASQNDHVRIISHGSIGWYIY